jgi:PAS domain S-box-containing protein
MNAMFIAADAIMTLPPRSPSIGGEVRPPIEACLARIVETAMDAIIVVDDAQRIVLCNAAAEAMFRCAHQALLGKPLAGLVPPRFRKGHRVQVGSFGRTGDTSRHAERLRAVQALRTDGEEFPAEVSISTTVVGGLRFYTAVIRDIAERVRAERLWDLEHAVTRILTEAETQAAAVESVLRQFGEIMDWPYGRYWRVDEAAGIARLAFTWRAPGAPEVRLLQMSEDMTFAPGEALVGRAWQSRAPMWVEDLGHDARMPDADLARVGGLKGAFLFPAIADGRVVGVLAFACREVREPDARLIAAAESLGGQIGQFLKRKEREEALRESEERFRGLTLLTSDWYWEQDARFRFTHVSSEGRTKGRFPIEGALGKARWELPIRVGDGAMAAHRADLEARRAFCDFEYEVVTDAGEVRYFSASGEPVFDGRGEFLGYRGTARDVTRRRLAEEAVLRLNAELEARVAERTRELEEAVAQLESYDASISHDLRAPLQRIIGFAEALREDAGDRLEDGCREHLARILAIGAQMSDLIADLLCLAKASRAPMRRVPVDASALARAVLAELRSGGSGRDVECVVEPGLSARADPGLLNVVLQNLLGNAWKFTSRRPDARIEFGSVPLDGEIAFRVRDNGAGFDAARAEELFRPFQRLHARSEFDGTGVGLATVQRIVQRHGGRVWAEGAPGEGASFYFTLAG